MRTFWKVFAITFLVFVIVFSGLAWSFDKYMRENNSSEPPVVVIDDGNNENNGVEQDKLMGLVKDSKRVNFVVLGLDGQKRYNDIYVL